MVNLYKCALTNLEIVSDAYAMTENTDVGCFELSSEFVIDNNEYGDTAGERVLDVVSTFGYTPVKYSKKEYIMYFKGYLKSVMAYLTKEKPEEVAAFKKHAGEFMKIFQKVKKDDLEFWMNEGNDPSGYVPWSYWKNPETDSAPTFMYFKYGLKLLKC